jgi:hypothetical protein
VRCFPCERQQALFEGHIQGFDFFGGIFPVLIIDYVPWNIIIVMWPSMICAVDLKEPFNHEAETGNIAT